MRDKKVILSEIDKLNESEARLRIELSKLSEQEQILLTQVGEDLIAGKADKSTNTLIEVRGKIEGYGRALSLIGQKMGEVRAELRDIEVQEAGKKLLEIQDQVDEELDALMIAIGETGAKAHIDKLLDLANQAEMLIPFQGHLAEVKADGFRFKFHTASSMLYNLWTYLEQEAAGRYKRPSRLAKTDFSPIPGFGRVQ
jgi:hypothetical protein